MNHTHVTPDELLADLKRIVEDLEVTTPNQNGLRKVFYALEGIIVHLIDSLDRRPIPPMNIMIGERAYKLQSWIDNNIRYVPLDSWTLDRFAYSPVSRQELNQRAELSMKEVMEIIRELEGLNIDPVTGLRKMA